MIHGVFFKKDCAEALRYSVRALSDRLVIDTKRNKAITHETEDAWFSYEQPNCFRYDPVSHLCVLAWGLVYNITELRDKLSCNTVESSAYCAADWILHTYLKYGDNGVAHLIGDFSFLIYDISAKTLLLAKDQMGGRPLYYYNDQHFFVCSTSLKIFHLLPDINIRPRCEWATQFLVGTALMMDFEKTPYEGVLKCPPAHRLKVNRQTIHKERYFAFHTEKKILKNSNEYLDYYQSHLTQAIHERMQIASPLGIEISGGIDSSTVAVLGLASYLGKTEEVAGFAFAMEEHEPKHIFSISQKLRIPVTHVCCSFDRPKIDPQTTLSILGAPNQHSVATGHDAFFRQAEQKGIKTFLSGFGGDEFVTTLHADLYLHELSREKKFLTLYQNFPGNPALRFLRLMKFLYRHRNRGVQNKRIQNALQQRWGHFVIAPQLIEKYALQSSYDAVAKFDQGYTNLDKFTLENRLHPFISTRMEECSLIAAHRGISYRWPLLDIRLIQCFLSIPTAEKYHKGQNRYLHRRAIKGKVPDNIVAQNTKHMGEKIVSKDFQKARLNDDLHPALLELIDFSKLKKQQNSLNKGDFNAEEWLCRTIDKNIGCVNDLDDWLKYFYPHHCTWAS